MDSIEILTDVTLSEALLFDSASAELQPGARQTLMKVADVLRPLGNPLRVQACMASYNLPLFDAADG